MLPRDRVLEAFDHREPDFVPIFFLGFTPQWVESVISRRPIDVVKDFLPVFERFDSDVVATGPDVFYPFDVYATKEKVDEWGRTIRVCGLYAEFVEFPIKKPEDIESYEAPSPYEPERTKEVTAVKKAIGDQRAIMAIVNGPLEPAWALRGFQTFLADLYRNPSLVEKCLDITTNFEIEVGKQLIDAGADIILIGDDYGMQQNLMFSPKLWRKLISPRLKQVVTAFKKRDALVVLHSDGNINPIIQDLVHIGLDGLNPIQTSAGVIPREVKEKYPSLTQVGTVDIQYTLPFGTPEEIETEIRGTIRDAGHSGGLVIGPQHAVQPDVPLKNVEIMVKAVRKFGRYPLQI